MLKRQINNESIDITHCSLKELPEYLREAKNLKRLNISGNQISTLPDWFQEFTKLEVLDARDNKLTSLCKVLDRLINLRTLYLRNNDISEIPISLQELKQLKTVSIPQNRIEKFPSWFFKIQNVSIDGNPTIDPPLEVLNRGVDSVRNYFLERENGTENLHEAKLLIIGEGGAGKTSLMNKLVNEDYNINPFLPSTKGIEIQPYYFKRNGIDFRINIWDFGGQEIYHATHQIFLTKRSLYLLLTDNRAEDTDFNYWLQTIELFSGNSPLIIVQNEKQDRKRDINIEGMKERFKNIAKLYSLNIATNKSSLRNLDREIQKQISNLPHIGTELPTIWISIRKK